MSSEVSVRLGADNSNYRSVMDQTVAVTDAASKKILQRLDLRSAVTILAAAIGLDLQKIANQVARLIIGFSEEAEENLNKLVQATDAAADAMEKKRDDARRRHKEAEADAAKRKAEEDEWWMRKGLEFRDAEAKDRKERREKDAKDAKQKQQDAFDDDVRWYKERASLEERLRGQRLAAAEPEERIAELTAEVVKWKREQLKLDKDSNEFKGLQVKINENNLDIERERKAIAAGTAKEEKKITDEKREQIAITASGRGDMDLSDRELARKAAQIRKDIAARDAAQFAGFGFNAGDAAAGGRFDLLLNQQRFNLANLQDVQRLRSDTRRNVAAFGEDRAFAMSNLTEQQFRDIIQNGNASTEQKLTDIYNLMKTQGLKVVVTNHPLVLAG